MDAHVRHASLPAPGDRAELCEWLGDYWSHRLDRARPLWDIVLLEGLEGWTLGAGHQDPPCDGGRVGSIDVGSLMLDTEPEPGERSVGAPQHTPAGEPKRGSSRGAQVVGALRWAPEHMVQAARFGAGIALHPRKAAELLERSRAAVEVLLRDELVGAPATSLNCRIGATRSFAVVEASLDDLKQIKNTLGGTVNDAVLAVVSGGLRRLLEARGEKPPKRGLRAMVPVNVREASEHLALGNKVSSLFVHLPVAEDSSLDRYRRVMAEAESLKSGSQALGTLRRSCRSTGARAARAPCHPCAVPLRRRVSST